MAQKYPLSSKVPTDFGTNAVTEDTEVRNYLNRVMIPTCRNMLDRINTILSIIRLVRGAPATTDEGNIHVNLTDGDPVVLWLKQKAGWMPKAYLAVPVTAATTETVKHYFGAYPSVQIFDSTGLVTAPTSITHDSVDQFTVVWGGPFTGTIVVVT
jgi:hypothetical protein